MLPVLWYNNNKIVQYNSHLLNISKLTRATTAITGHNIHEAVNVSSSRADGGTANTRQPDWN